MYRSIIIIGYDQDDPYNKLGDSSALRPCSYYKTIDVRVPRGLIRDVSIFSKKINGFVFLSYIFFIVLSGSF